MDNYNNYRLYGGVEFEPLNDVAMNDPWTIPSLFPLFKVAKTGAGLAPYASDIWHGRNLLFHKPFKLMNREEQKAYGRLGKQFYKNHIQPHVEHNKIIGDINFPGKSGGKSDAKYMEQYPFLRYNINKSNDNTYLPNNKPREDAQGFDNLRINWKGDDYAYQIKNSAYDNQKYFHNIKPYNLLKEQEPKSIDEGVIRGMLDFHLNKIKGQ